VVIAFDLSQLLDDFMPELGANSAGTSNKVVTLRSNFGKKPL
jgi:hypothetical protein